MRMKYDLYFAKLDEYESMITALDDEYEFNEEDVKRVKEAPEVFIDYLIFLTTRHLHEEDAARLNECIKSVVVFED